MKLFLQKNHDNLFPVLLEAFTLFKDNMSHEIYLYLLQYM